MFQRQVEYGPETDGDAVLLISCKEGGDLLVKDWSQPGRFASELHPWSR